jgi:hypothetical protein
MQSKSKTILSSHRDAATRVSTYLSEAHGITLKPIVALEVIARALGAANWQVLSAMAEQGRAPRIGDVGVWSDARDLPPLGHGSLLKDLKQIDGSPLAGGITRVFRNPAGFLVEQLRNSLALRGAVEMPQFALILNSAINSAQAAMGASYEFAPLQRKALETALSASVTFIRGGAGTGKSAVVSGLVRAAKAMGWASFNAVRPGANWHEGGQLPKEVNDVARLVTHVHLCELIVVDERIFVDPGLFRTVLDWASASCRLVVVFEDVPASWCHAEMSAMVEDVVRLQQVQQVRLLSRMRQSPILTSACALAATAGEPPAVSADVPNDALGMPKEVAHLTGVFDNGGVRPNNGAVEGVLAR